MKIKSKPKIKEMSKELTDYKRSNYVAPKKLNVFKLFFLKLIGVNLESPKFKVGDILKRKQSENPKELYEVKMNLYNSLLEPVIMAVDMQSSKVITITGYSLDSFKLYKDLMPGTIVDPKDD